MSDFVEVKTTELVGSALDWAVAMADGWEADRPQAGQIRKGDIYMLVGPFRLIGLGADKFYSPSTNWSQGGPIVEKEKIALQWIGYWDARCDRPRNEGGGSGYARGSTPLIALLRAIITAKLGETVHVPAELVNNSVNHDNT